MKILNFTEEKLKPALQDKSKQQSIRPAWDWRIVEGENSGGNPILVESKTEWTEQKKCRFTVGEEIKLMWKQRSWNRHCGNNCACWKNGLCTKFKSQPFHPEGVEFDCFSKTFGTGIVQSIEKIWMDTFKETNRWITLVVRDDKNKKSEPLEVITNTGIFYKATTPSISQLDGFKNAVEFKDFFLEHYPLLLTTSLPFWRIRWV